MSYLVIDGGYPLSGEIRVQGSKNAVLPILAACILVDGCVVLENCPDIADVNCMLRILKKMGCKIDRNGKTLSIDASDVDPEVNYEEEAGQMRSSILPAGALLGRFHQARIRKPGGCSIGERPINLHLFAFQQMGAILTEQEDEIEARFFSGDGERERRIIKLPSPSVGATENILLASALCSGYTVVNGAAKEPEVRALIDFLRAAGASIRQNERGTLFIEGKKKLHSLRFRISGDRIAALTYLGAGVITGGNVTVTDVIPSELAEVASYFERMGCSLIWYQDAVCLSSPFHLKSISHIRTQPHPGFPTDMQSQMMSILSTADGESKITEEIFENRFQTAEELQKMGADIRICGKEAWIRGTKTLCGARVKAKELRGGAALILAAAAAKGTSYLEGVEYIDRGYERVEEQFTQLGAKISRTRE